MTESGKQMYRLKTSPIEARQVTEDNLQEIAKWCGGEVMASLTGASYVAVPTNRGMQQALVGLNVVCHTPRLDRFSVITFRTFKELYEPIEKWPHV